MADATIVLKYNGSTGNAPSSLTQGEMAVNTADGKAWVGHSSGVQPINGFADQATFDDRVTFTGATSESNFTIIMKAQGSGSGTNQNHISFQEAGGTENGKITSNGFSTTYATSSDYRLKEDIQTVDNATERLLDLNPCNFQWKGSDFRVDGFLAHELAEVIPDAVVGEKDAVDEEGKPKYQGIDQSKVVPLLVAAIQELEARIKELEG